jgi:hypothetical protein
MAVGKLLGGQEGLFWVVPVSGGVLVLTTYLLGAVLATPAAGLIGAWLVATSPAMLFSLVAPMSDVPAAAAFSLTLYLLTISSRRRAVLAGLVAGLAFLIRPNLAICVMPLPLRYFFDRQASAAERWKLAALFALGVVPSLVFLMGFNSRMYGSMWETGYGSAEAFFATAHFWPNTKTYISHLIEVQTPLFLIGLAALAIPARRIWSSMDRGIRFAILVSHIVLWLFYCFYLHFEAWWYLRFLLPIWATVMVGTGAILVAATRPLGSFVRLAAIVGLGLLGVHFVKDANNRNVFVLWNGDRLHYVASASMVNEMTEKSSVIYSMQHSGSLRYYTGRVTLRYDVLDPAWLDKSVAWFVSQGVHPYLLIAEWERPTVLERFAGQQTLALLKQPPVFVNRNASDVSLYDLSPGPVSRKTVDRHGPFEGFRSVPPVEIREDALSLR